MATEMERAVVVDFPLRGEWVAFNSPGDRIPSHGTDMLGQIVEAEDGYPERSRIVPIREIALVFKNAATFNPSNLRPVLGNYVIARFGEVYAGFAHLVPGSVSVTAGQVVRSGDQIGRVGHTGNSTAPHLHFQLMDAPDILTAKGLPCAFQELEVERDGVWMTERGVVPRRTDRVRFERG